MDDQAAKLIGEKGYHCISTNRRDRLPQGVAKRYFHGEKTQVNERTKVGRYIQPVIAVKTFKGSGTKKDYRQVYVSFQSTSSCNLRTINSLSKCNCSIRKKERGRGINKRIWGIEMNEARELYLAMYGKLDTVDHFV